MAVEDDGEVILFRRPGTESTVFVSKLSPESTSEQLIRIFGEFGLVNDAAVFPGKGCGVVRFYSRRAARASLVLDGYPLSGSPSIAVEMAREVQTKRAPGGNQTLSVQKAIELCNNFIGFGSWTSRVSSLQPLPSSGAETGGKIRCGMSSTVVMSFPTNGGTIVTGRGIGRYAAKTRADAIEKARKFAVSAARRNAFSKIAIVLLDEGKVFVERIDSVDDDDVETREGEDDDDRGGGNEGDDKGDDGISL